MANWFPNASPTPLGVLSSGLPNMGDALIGWEQSITFEVITKTISGFEVYETTTPVTFGGVIQPLGGAVLMQKPEGQRDWTWWQIHSDPSLRLNSDDVIKYQGKQFRVMVQKDYSSYGYLEYHVIEDYTGSGPTVVTP